ncbi:MAG: hypothetical protein IPN20_23230 [Haliscomenobacter sp.]|nr:hypothetical protein [Haliscomenobacter sp.]
MKNFIKNLFVFGSFDFLKKGLHFAVVGENINDEKQQKIKRVIERIGNYTNKNQNQAQWASMRLDGENYIVMAFSYAGKDEHGRKTFISKGVILSDIEYSSIDYNPFFVLPQLNIDYGILQNEIGSLKSITFPINYDIQFISSVIEKEKDYLKNCLNTIWSGGKITFPFSSNHTNLLKAIFLVSTVKDRKKINFITCNSFNFNDLSITFNDNISSNPNFNGTLNKDFEKKFEKGIKAISSSNAGRYSDYIFEINREKKKGIINSILDTIKSKTS